MLLSYIDPSSVSILVTSIAGIAVAVSTTVVILWRRAKKKVANVLHIDENAGKEVEGELKLVDEADAESGNVEKTDAGETKTEEKVEETV